jgi:uncharacterized protein
MEKTVLDSFALLSLFHKEPGWKKVRDIFQEFSSAGEKTLLCRINWGEFYYIVRRRFGKQKSLETLMLLEQLPIEILSVDDQLVKEAAEIKAEYPLAYADAFCIATAKRYNAHILTSDPEFKHVESLVHITWLK